MISLREYLLRCHLSKHKMILLAWAFIFSATWTILVPGLIAGIVHVYKRSQVIDCLLSEKDSSYQILSWLNKKISPVPADRKHMQSLLRLEGMRTEIGYAKVNDLLSYGDSLKHPGYAISGSEKSPSKAKDSCCAKSKDSCCAWRALSDSFLGMRKTADPKGIPGRGLLDSSVYLVWSKLDHIDVSGFAENQAKYIWFFNTLAMLALILLIHPHSVGPNATANEIFRSYLKEVRSKPWRKLFWPAIGMYLLIEVPHLSQKLFVLNGIDSGRRQFTYVNPDISFCSFIFEELRTLFLFLEYVLLMWACHLDYQNVHEKSLKDVEVSDFLVGTNIQFQRWQVHSFILAGAFIPWTYFFWSSIKGQGDVRFAYVGFCIHLMWGFAWVMLTRPLLAIMREWSRVRTEIAARFLPGPATTPDQHQEVKNKLEIAKSIFEISPVSNLRLVFSSIVAVVSFLLPVLEALR